MYLDGSDVVITSELTAGWYRYITEWKLHDDGNLAPRFGFFAVRNPCTCRAPRAPRLLAAGHGFDGLDDHRVEEHNATETLMSPAGWRTLDRERAGTASPNLCATGITNRSYQLISGRDDAVADV